MNTKVVALPLPPQVNQSSDVPSRMRAAIAAIRVAAQADLRDELPKLLLAGQRAVSVVGAMAGARTMAWTDRHGETYIRVRLQLTGLRVEACELRPATKAERKLLRRGESRCMVIL
jgi:hypothetical protein